MNTLVRGQKLPIFSGPGLPALELAARTSWRARGRRTGEPFAVVFVGIGITARETQDFLERFERSGASERSVLYPQRDPRSHDRTAARAARRARPGGVPGLRGRACTCWS